MRGEVRRELRHPGIGHLRPVFVADAGVQVETMLGGQCDDLPFRGQQPLAHAHPMAQIATQLEVGETQQQVARAPRIVRDAAAMGLVRHRHLRFFLDGQDLSVKLLAFSGRPRVAAAVTVNMHGMERCGPDELVAERVHMRRNIAAGRINLGDVVELMRCQQGTEAHLVVRCRQPAFDAGIARSFGLGESCLPGFIHSPQVAEKFEFHAVYSSRSGLSVALSP